MGFFRHFADYGLQRGFKTANNQADTQGNCLKFESDYPLSREAEERVGERSNAGVISYRATLAPMH